MAAGRLALILVLLVLSGRTAAAEDWLIGGFVGGTFRGATGFVDVEQGVASRKRAFGASAGWWPDGWLGCEAEVAAMPNLFGGEAGLVPSSLGVGLNGNLLVTLPRRAWRVRPY